MRRDGSAGDAAAGCGAAGLEWRPQMEWRECRLAGYSNNRVIRYEAPQDCRATNGRKDNTGMLNVDDPILKTRNCYSQSNTR